MTPASVCDWHITVKNSHEVRRRAPRAQRQDCISTSVKFSSFQNQSENTWRMSSCLEEPRRPSSPAWHHSEAKRWQHHPVGVFQRLGRGHWDGDTVPSWGRAERTKWEHNPVIHPPTKQWPSANSQHTSGVLHLCECYLVPSNNPIKHDWRDQKMAAQQLPPSSLAGSAVWPNLAKFRFAPNTRQNKVSEL